jgi:hypothetical protein
MSLNKIQRAAILSLFIGIGFILLIVSDGNMALNVIGWIFCLVGGFNFGKMIRLMKK